MRVPGDLDNTASVDPSRTPAFLLALGLTTTLTQDLYAQRERESVGSEVPSSPASSATAGTSTAVNTPSVASTPAAADTPTAANITPDPSAPVLAPCSGPPLQFLGVLGLCEALDGDAFTHCMGAARESIACGLRQEGLADTDPRAVRLLTELERVTDADRGLAPRFVGALSALHSGDRVDFGLVSQGGIALGSWQAGMAYVLTEWARERKRAEVRKYAVVTGASAGAVNGFAAAVSSCLAEDVPPDESLFYRIWVDALAAFGRHEQAGLLDTDSSDPLALLDDSPIREVGMRAVTDLMNNRKFTPGCQTDFGFPVTHVDSQTIPAFIDLSGQPLIERTSLRERFALHLAVPEGGAARIGGPKATNIERDPRERFFANLGYEPDVQQPILMRAVQASGAVPAAFPPVRLPYQTRGYDGSVHEKIGTFVDGGTLDNTPIGIALKLRRWQRDAHKDANPYFAGVPQPDRITYFILEPNITEWQRHNPKMPKPSAVGGSLLTTGGNFVYNLYASSTEAEFLSSITSEPGLATAHNDWTSPRQTVAIRHLPIAGAELGAFLGFFELDFRSFDFYVGMADARRFLEDEERLLQAGSEPATMNKLHAEWAGSDIRYKCMSAYYDEWFPDKPNDNVPPKRQAIKSLGELRKYCADLLPTDEPLEVGDFRKTTRTRVSDPYAAAKTDRGNPVSKRNFVGMLAAMHNYRLELEAKSADEPIFASFMKAVTTEEKPGEPWFHFIDVLDDDVLTTLGGILDDGTLDADEFTNVLWSKLHDSVTHLANTQDELRWPFKLGVRPGLDALFDVKTWHKYTVGVGLSRGLEVYAGRRVWYGLRWDLGTRLFSLHSPSFQPKRVDEEPLSGDVYTRWLWQDAVGFLDPYLQLGLGCLDALQGCYGSVGAGARLTFFDRLSFALGYEHAVALNGSDDWGRMPASATFQFLF